MDTTVIVQVVSITMPIVMVVFSYAKLTTRIERYEHDIKELQKQNSLQLESNTRSLLEARDQDYATESLKTRIETVDKKVDTEGKYTDRRFNFTNAEVETLRGCVTKLKEKTTEVEREINEILLRHQIKGQAGRRSSDASESD